MVSLWAITAQIKKTGLQGGHFVRWNWVCLRWSSYSWDFLGCSLTLKLHYHDDSSTTQWTGVWICQQWDGRNQSGTISPEKSLFQMQLSVVVDFFFHDSTYRVCISVQTRRAQWPTVCLFLHDTLYAILLKNEIHFKTNKTSVNSMATGVGLACDL